MPITLLLPTAKMEPQYGQDKEYLSYLYTRVHDKDALQESGALTKAIALNLPKSAELMLITMGITEKRRTRMETLRRIASMRAWDLVMDCDTRSSAATSLQRLAFSYKYYIPDLMGSLGGIRSSNVDTPGPTGYVNRE